jgi:outer membrane protein assembly factor BamB
MNPNLLSIIMAGLCLTTASLAKDSEWSRFRGPNGSGISDAKSVPVRWTDKDYNWKAELPAPGHSSPVAWQDRLFVTCGDPKTALRSLLCIDAKSGRMYWRHDEPSRTYGQHRDNSYATETPTVDGQGVVTAWSTPQALMLLALDLEGRELWRRDLGPVVSLQGSGSSPILVGDTVVLVNDQEDMERSPGRRPNGPNPKGSSFVIAVDRKTGITRWQTEITTFLAGYSTPCIFRDAEGGEQLILSTTAHGLLAIDPGTGKKLWEFGQPFLDRAVVSPVLGPGIVLAGHGAGIRGSRCLAVRPGGSRAQREPATAFELTKNIPMVPTPLARGNRLFLWCDDGVVSCLNVNTGETVWRDRVEGNYYASPIWVDGRLYNVSKTGDVVVISAGEKFELLHRIALGDSSYATPAVSDGVMYLRTNKHLFSLGGRDPGSNAR